MGGSEQRKKRAKKWTLLELAAIAEEEKCCNYLCFWKPGDHGKKRTA